MHNLPDLPNVLSRESRFIFFLVDLASETKNLTSITVNTAQL